MTEDVYRELECLSPDRKYEYIDGMALTEVEYQIDSPHQRQLFTVLDIGTTSAKAILIELNGDRVEVLGVGHHVQNHTSMAGSIITNISEVILNCNEALLKAEKSAGGVIAPLVVVGITGELVKGSSVIVSKQRADAHEPITTEELEVLITDAQKHLLKNAKERIAVETGYTNIDVYLTNSAVISVRIDGQVITNPIGFRGRQFALTLFSAFAPLSQLGALETVAQGLDLTLVTIVAEPYALARCFGSNASADSDAIFIDVGGGTTDIALVRQGCIEETRTFALGGLTFTRRIAVSKGISIKDAERLKISYSDGEIKGSSYDEIQSILAPECQTWMDSVELLIEEISRREPLPSILYLVGGGSVLPDIHERLEKFPWTKRLPFSRQPAIQTIQPEMVTSIDDPRGLLASTLDITTIALAYQTVELQNENNALARALDRVINTMHI